MRVPGDWTQGLMLAEQALCHLSHLLPAPLPGSQMLPSSSFLPSSQAMDLEVPVLARNIPGNSAVVEHGVTGLLFSNPQEFIQLAKRLVSDPALEKEIVTNGREYVRTHHSWQVERDTYQRLIRKLETNLED